MVNLDNDFEKAREEFAKLVWLSTRNGLDMSDVDNPKIIFSSDFVNIGEIPPLYSGPHHIIASEVQISSLDLWIF